MMIHTHRAGEAPPHISLLTWSHSPLADALVCPGYRLLNGWMNCEFRERIKMSRAEVKTTSTLLLLARTKVHLVVPRRVLVRRQAEVLKL